MKKYMFAALLCAAFFFGANTPADAQVRVGVNINIGDQPRWRQPGYDYVEYYYLPDIDVYYYVPARHFIYLSGGRWIHSSSLPYRYRDYDLYSGYKVVVNRHNAYEYYEQDRRLYGRKQYNGRYNGHDNGRHNGHYKQKRRH